MKNLVIIFAKYPDYGKVKTRLARQIGQICSTILYKNLVENTVKEALKTGMEVRIEYTPKERSENFKLWLGRNLHFKEQEGKDLGIRIFNAFRATFKNGYMKAVLIGTDIPGLKSTDLKKALHLLSNRDAVIGPAADGGYYLIGFKKDKVSKEVFRNIPWSTKDVFKKTLPVFKKLGYSFEVLETKNDIDTVSDLKILTKNYKN